METDALRAMRKESFRRDFDAASLTWDDNPHRRALTARIAESIREAVPMQASWDVLEYGCGTAALSVLLAQSVRHITAADSSKGMIEQTRQKLQALPGLPVTPVLLDLEKDPPLDRRFDLIAMAMVLHHVEDIRGLFGQLATMLRPGGWMAIADLCIEDGSFHSPDRVPHNGFAPETLAQQIGAVVPVRESTWRVIHQVQKARPYDVFLLTLQGGG